MGIQVLAMRPCRPVFTIFYFEARDSVRKWRTICRSATIQIRRNMIREYLSLCFLVSAWGCEPGKSHIFFLNLMKIPENHLKSIKTQKKQIAKNLRKSKNMQENHLKSRKIHRNPKTLQKIPWNLRKSKNQSWKILCTRSKPISPEVNLYTNSNPISPEANLCTSSKSISPEANFVRGQSLSPPKRISVRAQSLFPQRRISVPA